MNDSRQSRTKGLESKIRRVTKISISEEIAKQIMDLIASGDLAPGERLPAERDLCQRFGASRTSLREALRCLSIVGVLNARVKEGTSVALDGRKFLRRIMEWRLITEKHDIQNLLKVRMALEGESAADAAVHHTKEDMDGLQELLAKMKKSLRNEVEFAVLDLEFHITIAAASGNSLLSDMVSMIRSQLMRALSKVLRLPNAIPLSLKEHSAIVKAIKSRNPEAARFAMQAHLGRVLRGYGSASETARITKTPRKSPKAGFSRVKGALVK